MPENTQPDAPANIPTAYGWCSWHENYARGVRLIHAVEQCSGLGASLFACPACRQAYDLLPLADQPCTPTS